MPKPQTTNGYALKQVGIHQTQAHNPLTLQNVLMHLEIIRKCRLRMKWWDQVFTIEQLMEDLKSLFKYPVPHGLHGSIAQQAKAKEIISATGKYVKAKRDSRHENIVPEYTWRLY